MNYLDFKIFLAPVDVIFVQCDPFPNTHTSNTFFFSSFVTVFPPLPLSAIPLTPTVPKTERSFIFFLVRLRSLMA